MMGSSSWLANSRQITDIYHNYLGSENLPGEGDVTVYIRVRYVKFTISKISVSKLKC